MIRRYARSDARRKARELFQNFVTAFIRRGDQTDFVPAARNGILDELFEMVIADSARLKASERSDIVCRFVYQESEPCRVAPSTCHGSSI